MYLRLRYPHLKSISQRPMNKLTPKYFGPFTITDKLEKVAYKLQLPEGTKIHPVFHVSLLKRATGAEQANPELPLLLEEKDEQKEPEAIVDMRVVYNQGVPLIQVLVKWGPGDTNGDT